MSDTGATGGSRESSRLVRAYAVTRGRTHSNHYDLDVETLVSTTSRGEASAPMLGFEQREVWPALRALAPVDDHQQLVGHVPDEHLGDAERPVEVR